MLRIAQRLPALLQVPVFQARLFQARLFQTLCFSTLLLWSVGCAPDAGDEPTDAGADTTAAKADDRIDTHSFARPAEAAVRHLDLDLTVDFDAKTLQGKAVLHLERQADATDLRLDTRDLTVSKVSVGAAADGEMSDVEIQMGDADPFLGQELTVPLAADTQVVAVEYTTDPGAGALQWLEPAMTTGGEHPFLFTQSQAILARTWVPCQDTPAVRFTYDATVRVPEGLMAIMSAENPTEKSADGVYTFKMPQAIPSYLLALGVGDLEFRSMGDQTGVYAEPSVVEAAAWEFAETEAMIDAVEPLYGPYRWGRFDMLVLPPSFPFGGMENPRLTFATPTILAGDRSLVALVAHELAHSWSGNLVTNATWNDFWLNEGFTVYLERRIMEVVKGPDYAAMLTKLGLQDLQGTIESKGHEHPDTHLFQDLENRDPDDGMTDIAYEKGYFFLRMIEETVGRERFDTFLRAWFEANAFESKTTAEFVDYLNAELVAGDQALADALQIDAWVYGPGLPPNAPTIESDAFAKVDAARQAWMDGADPSSLETKDWTTHEWLHFLRGIPVDVGGDKLAALDGAFGFNSTGNSEVLNEWLLHVIGSRYEPGYASLESFLTRQGRRKFLAPLYSALAADAELKPMADRIYKEARAGYHPVSVGTIDEILSWQG